MGDWCPICGTVGVVSQYTNLSLEAQTLLSALVDDMYVPDDGTDLQELAARAYNFGKED
jgi:hypothetical protein